MLEKCFTHIDMFAAVLTFTAGCVPPDCERVDEGSCLNACCKLQWELPSISALDFAQNVSALLASGGPDGRFSRFNNTPPEQMWSQRGTYVVQGFHVSI